MIKTAIFNRNKNSFINEISKPNSNITNHGKGHYSMSNEYEPFEKFVKRVEEFANRYKTTNINFVDKYTAVIIYEIKF